MYIVRSGQVLGICSLHCLSFFTGTVSNRFIVHDLLQACTQRLLWLYAPGPHNALIKVIKAQETSPNNIQGFIHGPHRRKQCSTKSITGLRCGPNHAAVFMANAWCMVYFIVPGGVWHVSLEIGRKIRP